ncbi:MAG: hypothetical protein RBT20_03450 [Syntrophales bacterium]|nr:hypothetical protein [Syntrophales bacterium]
MKAAEVFLAKATLSVTGCHRLNCGTKLSTLFRVSRETDLRLLNPLSEKLPASVAENAV